MAKEAPPSISHSREMAPLYVRFPSLQKYGQSWEPLPDLATLGRKSAVFAAMDYVFEDQRNAGHRLFLDHATLKTLIGELDTDKERAAVFESHARWIAAWYFEPKRRAAMLQDDDAYLAALSSAAKDAARLLDTIEPLGHSFEAWFSDAAEHAGSQFDGNIDLQQLGDTVRAFVVLADRVTDAAKGKAGRKTEVRRDHAIALATTAVEAATSERVRASRKTVANPQPHFSTTSGRYVCQFMAMLGWPDETVIAGAFCRLSQKASA